MELIYDIVRKLKKQEIRQVKQLIKHAAFEYEKMGKLFELVTRYEQQEEAFYAQKLYGRPPDNTFRVTKSRLKRMLENVLLNDKSLNSYPKPISIRLQIRKKILQAEILLGRGAYLAGKNLLQQVIAQAQRHELNDELFQAEMLLSRTQSVRLPVREYEHHTERLLALNRRQAAIQEVSIRYYSISNLLAHKALKPDQQQEVRQAIDRMAAICAETQHPPTRNLYLLAEIYYHQVIHQYEAALAFCHQYLHLLETAAELHTGQRLAVAYGQLAQVHLHLHQLDEARRYATLALGAFAPDEMNYLRGLELMFVIDFHAGRLAQAQAHIELAMRHPEFQASRMLAAKWHYFLACLHFSQGAYQMAYHTLNDTNALLADKYGLNLNIRLLEIMLLYELRHLDLMETKILNMRQFIKRTQKQAELLRPKALIRLLIKWHQNDYNAAATLAAAPEDLDLLRAPQHFNPGIDLIRLEDWLTQQAG
jgi:tetratricopeptide (TPR) repeat protein